MYQVAQRARAKPRVRLRTPALFLSLVSLSSSTNIGRAEGRGHSTLPLTGQGIARGSWSCCRGLNDGISDCIEEQDDAMRPPAARDIRGGSPRQHGCPILAPACPGGATDDGAIAQGATRHVGLCAHLLGNVPRAGRRHTVPRQVQASEARRGAPGAAARRARAARRRARALSSGPPGTRTRRAVCRAGGLLRVRAWAGRLGNALLQVANCLSLAVAVDAGAGCACALPGGGPARC